MGVNEGNADCLVEKWEIYGLKRPKIKVSVGNKAMGGGALVRAPEEKWGKMGENGGKWGEMGRKWGGNGEEMGRKWEDKWGSFRLLNSKAVWRAWLSPLCPCPSQF